MIYDLVEIYESKDLLEKINIKLINYQVYQLIIGD